MLPLVVLGGGLVLVFIATLQSSERQLHWTNGATEAQGVEPHKRGGDKAETGPWSLGFKASDFLTSQRLPQETSCLLPAP